MQQLKEFAECDTPCEVFNEANRIFCINKEFRGTITVDSFSDFLQELKPENAGRAGLGRFVLSDSRRIVVREYARGGLAAFFARKTFVNSPVSRILHKELLSFRPYAEFSLLRELGACGLPVPVPVVCYIKKKAFSCLYNGVIATEEIPNAVNLLMELKKLGRDELLEVVWQTGNIARRCLEKGVYHPDLHIGNVLLSDGKVYLIDFDKGCRFNPSPFYHKYYAGQLLRRWVKSCQKHGAGSKVVEAFRKGLQNEGQ